MAPNTDPNSPNIMDILNQVSSNPTNQPPNPDANTQVPLLPASAPSSVPAPLAPAASGTADLESRLPRNIPLGSAAMQASDDNNQRSLTNPDADLTGAKPGFLDRLKGYATSPTGISSILSGVGSSLALAAGGPKQKELAAEMQQLQNEAAYRNGILGVNAANAGSKRLTAETGAKTEQEKFAAADNDLGIPEGTTRAMAETARQNMLSNQNLRQEHIKQMEATMNGEIMVPPGMGTAIGRPELEGQSLPALRFTQEVANPYKLLGVKAQNLGTEGVWGTSPLTGRIIRLGDSPSVAQEQGYLMRTQLPINDVQGNTTGWVNPQTRTFTPIGAVPGATQSIGSATMPPKPTSSMLNRGQMASSILENTPALQKEVQSLADKVGPGAGRWNDYWVNKGGVNDPAYAGLQQDLKLYASAISMSHFGAGAPLDFTNALEKDFSAAQSPEDLQARIQHADVWLQGYAQRAGRGEAQPTAPKSNNGTTPKTNNASEIKEGSTATGPNNHKILYTGGRWVDAATKQPI